MIKLHSSFFREKIKCYSWWHLMCYHFKVISTVEDFLFAMQEIYICLQVLMQKWKAVYLFSELNIFFLSFIRSFWNRGKKLCRRLTTGIWPSSAVLSHVVHHHNLMHSEVHKHVDQTRLINPDYSGTHLTVFHLFQQTTCPSGMYGSH